MAAHTATCRVHTLAVRNVGVLGSGSSQRMTLKLSGLGSATTYPYCKTTFQKCTVKEPFMMEGIQEDRKTALDMNKDVCSISMCFPDQGGFTVEVDKLKEGWTAVWSKPEDCHFPVRVEVTISFAGVAGAKRTAETHMIDLQDPKQLVRTGGGGCCTIA